MFSNRASIAQYNQQNLMIWLSMAFQAGAINAGGFLACHRFVTHTTGFATFFGTEFAQGHFIEAAGMLTVPLFFLFGAMISGYFIDQRLAMSKMPRYDWMFGFIGLSMIVVAFAGEEGTFGIFGAPMILVHDYSLMALLCLCSGIQNATVTVASGSVVRTTHLTGITTDLGIGLIRVFSKGHNATVRASETRGNWMRGGIILSFLFGSMVSAFLYFHVRYLGFLLPAAISLGLTVMALWKKRPPQSGVQNARAS